MTRRAVERRAGFTLIEMFVVLLIILLLMALLLPALNRGLTYARQTSTRTEIGQLDAAVQSFMSKMDVQWVPSQLKLCKWPTDYGSTQLDTDSKQFLLRLFPKLTAGSGQTSPPTAPYGMWATDASGNLYTGMGVTTGVNWTLDSSWTSVTTHPAMGSGPTDVLEGHQVLVFCLGGIQLVTGSGANKMCTCTGFSTNPLNPSDTTATIDRIPPFFEFTAKRLVAVPWVSGTSLFTNDGGSPPRALFASYNDPIGQPPTSGAAHPYLYFSSYKSVNGYARTATGYGSAGDNPTYGVTPYSISGTSPTQFVNPSTYQIICAGFDGQFGPGGAWASNGSLSTGVGADDMSNFTPGQMKAGQ